MEPSGPGTKAVDNETTSTASRTTRDGRKLSYSLTVLQQPLRARACGSGAKSSADRRPVDPPPIVELKVFEGADEDRRDITFSINANYFLFATLEQARVIAHGRNMPDNQTQLTVLTGTPVSGMVLLDRPTPAGYFIFPDLSVRHEGKFRLSFSLYEELKNAQDDDQEEPGRPEAHVTHRLEVKSHPFTVYSAKKFPGLTESTSLSRMVAEQGCRVRIRRDVRMRRRDQKTGKDWDGYEDETAEARARMSATPEVLGYQGLPPPHHYMDPISRPRSSSNASHHSLAPSLPLSLNRRSSQQDLGYSQPAYSTAPHTPQSAYPQQSPYGPSPTHSYGPPSFMQHPSMQPPPPQQYQQPTYQQPSALPQPASSQPSNYYSYGASAAPTHSHVAPGAQAYETQEGRHRSSVDHSMQMSNEHRRSSEIGYGPPPPRPAHVPEFSFSGHMIPQPSYQPQSHNSYSAHNGHQQSYGSSDSGYGSRAVPPEPVQPPTRPTYSTPPLPARPFNDTTLPPLRPPPLNTSHTSISSKQLEPSSPASSIPQSSYWSAVHTPTESHKRGFGQVFGDSHTHQPLRQGARPSTNSHLDYQSSYYGGADVEGDDHSTHQLKMTYKRSDGSKVERTMPTHHAFA